MTACCVLKFVILTIHLCSCIVYRKVTAAAEHQLRRLWHTTNIYVFPTLHEYCEKLAAHLPDPLKVLVFQFDHQMAGAVISLWAEAEMSAGLLFPCLGCVSDEQRLRSQ